MFLPFSFAFVYVIDFPRVMVNPNVYLHFAVIDKAHEATVKSIHPLTDADLLSDRRYKNFSATR